MTCSIEGCAKEAHSRGWCHGHYKKWHLHGDPNHGTTYLRRHGEGTITSAGYVAVMIDGKKRQQHILVMEEELGHALPTGAVVHHRDRDRTNNDISNLVLCRDQAQHLTLHLQEKAIAAGAPPFFRACIHCKTHDAPDNMTKTGGKVHGYYHYHKACHALASKQRTAK